MAGIKSEFRDTKLLIRSMAAATGAAAPEGLLSTAKEKLPALTINPLKGLLKSLQIFGLSKPRVLDAKFEKAC